MTAAAAGETRAATAAVPWHPFTAALAVLAVTLLALLLPAPGGPVALLLLVVAWVARAPADDGWPRQRSRGAVLRAAALAALPFWALLLVLHALLGEGPRVAAGPVSLSRAGLALAVAQGSRLTAILVASGAFLASFRPARFLDACAARGWPVSWAYVVTAALEAIPLLTARAAAILDAQRVRGLRTRRPLDRLRALPPLALPLLLGTLAEVDDRAMGLAARGVGRATRRTALFPPADPPRDRIARAAMLAAVLAALVWRFLAAR